MVTEIVPNEAAQNLINASWENVFKVSAKIIHQSGVYGFNGIELIPNPNIHQMLASLSIVSDMLTRIVGLLDRIELDHDSIRKLLNAQKTIQLLENVASSLLAGERSDYDGAIAELKNQGTF